uniref:Uncharacterized protein n=1 Tax=Rhizophora mucronata TaxID=61149 RepID=A0A2P2KTI8_RHIMU
MKERPVNFKQNFVRKNADLNINSTNCLENSCREPKANHPLRTTVH